MNRAALVVGLSLLLAGAVRAEQADPILAENTLAKLTLADYEAELSRLPVALRGDFATDVKRITALLNKLLIAKTLAAHARKAGIERDPLVQRRLVLEADRVLASLEVQRIEEAAGVDFDGKASQFMIKARELYLVDRAKYRTGEQVTASHILFDTKSRSADSALAAAREARAKLLAGADFSTLAKELSDDPSAKSNGGHLDWFSAEQMDPAFAATALSLKNVGDISEPVRSSFGYHLIRLEGRRPAAQKTFDEVKVQIMADLRKRYIDEQRELKINAIRNDPDMKVNQSALDALVQHVDPELFNPVMPPPAK